MSLVSAHTASQRLSHSVLVDLNAWAIGRLSAARVDKAKIIFMHLALATFAELEDILPSRRKGGVIHADGRP